MKWIRPFPMMAMAMLAATPGIVQAQPHVVGGMGEEVRLGAFANPGSRVEAERRGFNPKIAKARTQGPDWHGPRPASARGPAPTLPGRHLP